MKYRNPFFPIVITLFIMMFALTTLPIFANSNKSNDARLVRQYCKENYPKHTIRIINKYDAKIFENRKGKNIVYIEKFVSYSQGKYGYSKKGEYVVYNKYVKKGKKVVSYFIYNPKTNYCDDVVAVVDNKKIR